MPRPVSWLPALAAIRKSIGNSVRSHYDRRDLELLFNLQPSAAGKLLEILPSVAIGTAKLVERETLAKFLEDVHAADDVPALINRMRTERKASSRRKPRYLFPPVDQSGMKAMPAAVTLTRGRLEVKFATALELCEAMYAVAEVVECREFEDLYAPQTAGFEVDPAAEVRAMFANLEELEGAFQVANTLEKRTPAGVTQQVECYESAQGA